jgi:diguanylate cyclase (GGDEF)-like protein/PAS domain S-box-containing protein
MPDDFHVEMASFDFAALAGNDRDIVVVVDAQGLVLSCSASIEHILGYHVTEVTGRNFFDSIHPSDCPTPTQTNSQIDMLDAVTAVAVRFRHANGSWIAFEIFSHNRLASDGVVVLTARNITERRRLESARRDNEERFRALASAAPVAIFMCAEDGYCDFVNNEWTVLSGQSTTDALGKGWQPLLGIGGFERIRYASPDDSGKLELNVNRTDGQIRRVLARWSWLADPKGLRHNAVLTFEDITERKALEAQLSHQATHDALTGLPNRLFINEHLRSMLTRARITNHCVGVVFCDLDRFKSVNDRLGHEAGDRLLNAVATRLLHSLKPTDLVGRFGGDEFIIIRVEATVGHVNDQLEHDIRAAFVEPFDIGLGRTQRCDTSLGLAWSDDDSTPESMLRDADMAMYRAKALGRGRSEEFDATLRESALDRIALENDLPGAAARGELVLHYQPIVDIDGTGPCSVEALVRWNHPTRGQLSPDGFISLAEETGVISEIGEWVLRQACRDVRAIDDLSVNVNVSGKQILDERLAERFQMIMTEEHFPATRLVVEITESVLMTDVGHTVRTLSELKALGVRIAVDDFGTGYSALSYLSMFPIDSLKIDKSFVQGLGRTSGDKDIVQAILALASSLQLHTTAEGVETQGQLEQLQALACDSAQGFLLHRPMTIDMLRAFRHTSVAVGN